MQEDKDIKLTIAPTPAEGTAVQEELASAPVEEKIDKDLTENAQDAADRPLDDHDAHHPGDPGGSCPHGKDFQR